MEKYQSPVFPINIGQWTGSIIQPNLLNIVTSNIQGKNLVSIFDFELEFSERYNIISLFHRLWSCRRNYLTNPTRIFEKILSRVNSETPEIGDYVAAILRKISDYTVLPDNLSGLTDVHFRFYVQYVAWSMVTTCLHIRIKSRMTNLAGKVDPLFKNIQGLKYVNFPLFLQLLSRDRIWEIQRKFPLLIPHEKDILRVVGNWKVSFSRFCNEILILIFQFSRI